MKAKKIKKVPGLTRDMTSISIHDFFGEMDAFSALPKNPTRFLPCSPEAEQGKIWWLSSSPGEGSYIRILYLDIIYIPGTPSTLFLRQ